jgi:hypothetical protein
MHPRHAYHSPVFHSDTLDLPWQKVKIKIKFALEKGHEGPKEEVNV